MKEYIIADDFIDDITKKFASAQGQLKELIRCKDCKYCPYKAITYASADPYLESYPHCFQKDENWYCGDAEREEE